MSTHLYVLVAPAGGTEMCFKVGISADFRKRRREVQTGCPFPITEILHVTMASCSNARDAERYMHGRLSPYKSSGEWFLFDTANPAHKADFNAAAKAVLTPMLGCNWKWTRIKVSLDEAATRIAKRVPERKHNMPGATDPTNWDVVLAK